MKILKKILMIYSFALSVASAAYGDTFLKRDGTKFEGDFITQESGIIIYKNEEGMKKSAPSESIFRVIGEDGKILYPVAAARAVITYPEADFYLKDSSSFRAQIIRIDDSLVTYRLDNHSAALFLPVNNLEKVIGDDGKILYPVPKTEPVYYEADFYLKDNTSFHAQLITIENSLVTYKKSNSSTEKYLLLNNVNKVIGENGTVLYSTEGISEKLQDSANRNMQNNANAGSQNYAREVSVLTGFGIINQMLAFSMDFANGPNSVIGPRLHVVANPNRNQAAMAGMGMAFYLGNVQDSNIRLFTEYQIGLFTLTGSASSSYNSAYKSKYSANGFHNEILFGFSSLDKASGLALKASFGLMVNIPVNSSKNFKASPTGGPILKLEVGFVI